MITVNRFQLSADMQFLYVEVTASDGRFIDKFTIETEATYNDSKIDLTSKLSKTSETEILTLVPFDLGITSFNGIYIGEFTTVIDEETENFEVATAAACNFSQFFYCINDKLVKINGECISCDESLQDALVIDLYLEGLKTALITGRYNDAIINYYSLNKLCCGTIDMCLNGCTSGYGVLNGAFILT